jgi:hypothetical protein
MKEFYAKEYEEIYGHKPEVKKTEVPEASGIETHEDFEEMKALAREMISSDSDDESEESENSQDSSSNHKRSKTSE